MKLSMIYENRTPTQFISTAKLRKLSHMSKFDTKIYDFFTSNATILRKIYIFLKNILWNEKKAVILHAETLNSEDTTIANPQKGPQQRRGRVEKEMPNRINDKIRGVKEVRLVGDNVEQGVYSFETAMRIADDMNLDLVEISPNAVPPVCRILDYQKFLYQKKRKEKEQKANSAKVVIKEIRFGPQTDEHDYNFKLKHAQEFLKDGNKVKAYVFFRGRSILFKEQGELLLARFANDLEEYGKVEAMPKLEGKRMIVNIAPKK